MHYSFNRKCPVARRSFVAGAPAEKRITCGWLPNKGVAVYASSDESGS